MIGSYWMVFGAVYKMHILRGVPVKMYGCAGLRFFSSHRLACLHKLIPMEKTELFTTYRHYNLHTATCKNLITTFSKQQKYCQVTPDLLQTYPDVHSMSRRQYAKGKNKGRNKGGKSGHVAMKLSDEELRSVLDWQQFEGRLQAELEHIRTEYTEKLTLRTSIGAFNNLLVETTDGKLPLIQLAHVSQKGQQTVVVDMSMNPQYIPPTKTAFTQSLGLNPQQDGTTLFVSIPKVTKEHREDLAKTAKLMCNSGKIRLRDIQSKAIQQVNKVKDAHSEDLIFSVQTSIQTLTKTYTDRADQLLADKTKELLRAK